EQIQNTVVVLFDNRILATDHVFQFELDAAQFNAMLGNMVVGLFKMLGRLQQSFGRNAADIGAGTAWFGIAGLISPGINTRYFLAQLRSANRCNVAARTGTNYDNVKL